MPAARASCAAAFGPCRYDRRMLAPALALLAALAPQAEPPALDAAEFRALHAAVVPTAAEPWQTIPWRTDLGAARAEAAELERPLFLWTMNGHPLGCT